MSWYARIVADVAELQPTMASPIECIFATIARETPDPSSNRWRSVVNTIAGVLQRTTEQQSSLSYKQLEAFVRENEDLLISDPVVIALSAAGN